MPGMGGIMAATWRAAPIAICMVVFATGALGLQTPEQERRLQLEAAADLRSGDPERMGSALALMAKMPPGEWGADLRGALLTALTREIQDEAFGDDPHVAIYPMFELAIQVAASGDVRAAPVLARHGGFGQRQMDLLVSLGEPGLRALLEFAPETQPHDNGTDVGHQRVIATLHLFVHDWGIGTFDAETQQQIRVLAERALAGPTDPGVLEWGAIGLALLVGGPDLRSAVEEMAADDEEVRKRLFIPTEPWRWNADYEAGSIDRIRREAAYLLADPQRTPYYRRPGCRPDRAFPKPPYCPV